MKLLGISGIALLIVGVATIPLHAQTRVSAPQQPTQQGIQVPSVDPVMQRLNAIQSELDLLKESSGRQVVVLHFTPTELRGWADNTVNANKQRGENICKQALGDRYGREISHRNGINGDLHTFTHVVCETKV